MTSLWRWSCFRTVTIVLVGAFAHFLLLCVPAPCLGNGLAKVDLDASVINQSVVHFEKGFGTLLLGTKLDKGVLERVARFGIPNNFGLAVGIESRKDEFEVFVFGNGVEFAHKQDIVGCLDVGRRQITQHFQHNGTAMVLFLGNLFLPLTIPFFVLLIFFQIHLVRLNPSFDRLFGWFVVVW